MAYPLGHERLVHCCFRSSYRVTRNKWLVQSSCRGKRPTETHIYHLNLLRKRTECVGLRNVLVLARCDIWLTPRDSEMPRSARSDAESTGAQSGERNSEMGRVHGHADWSMSGRKGEVICVVCATMLEVDGAGAVAQAAGYRCYSAVLRYRLDSRS